MKVAKSSFYYNPKLRGGDLMKVEADLLDRIEATCLEFPRYGYRRVTNQLKHEGCQVNHKKVLQLMRESDLLCHIKHKWVKTTDSQHRFPRYPKSNACLERFNRTIQEQFVNWHIDEMDEPDEFNRKLMEYLIWYNTEKPHHGQSFLIQE